MFCSDALDEIPDDFPIVLQQLFVFSDEIDELVSQEGEIPVIGRRIGFVSVKVVYEKEMLGFLSESGMLEIFCFNVIWPDCGD